MKICSLYFTLHWFWEAEIKKKTHQQIKHSTPKRLTGAESHLRLFRLSSKGENRTRVGKVRNNLKTQHLNCSRRESNFPHVCRSPGCVMSIMAAIRSCARLMHQLFADDLMLFAWERFPDEHQQPFGGPGEYRLLRVEAETFSGSLSNQSLLNGVSSV